MTSNITRRSASAGIGAVLASPALTAKLAFSQKLYTRDAVSK
jgi:hypothetical protein